MAEFAYNKAKNANTGYMPFKLNYNNHHHMSFKDEINPCLRSFFAYELVKELRK